MSTFEDHRAPARQRRRLTRERAILRALAYLRLAAWLRRHEFNSEDRSAASDGGWPTRIEEG